LGPLDNVPLLHGRRGQDAIEAQIRQVQRLEAVVQDHLGYRAADGWRVLQAVAAEARGEVHVLYQRVEAQDGVLVEGVVVVVAGPGAGHLGEKMVVVVVVVSKCYKYIRCLWYGTGKYAHWYHT